MKWTAEESALIEAYYPDLGAIAFQAKHMPHMTVDQIRNRAGKLGVKFEGARIGNGRAWPQEELTVLASVYPSGGARAVQALLPLRKGTEIRAKAHRMGLKCEMGVDGKVVQPSQEHTDDSWPLPAMDLLESLDCVRLQKWKSTADAPRLQLFGLVGVEMARAAA